MFGIQVYNDAGDLVLDSNDPSLIAVGKGTLSLSPYDDRFGDPFVSNELGTNANRVADNRHLGVLPALPAGTFYLFEIPDNKRVHCNTTTSGIGVYSDQPTVRWVSCNWARNLAPKTSGFGLETYDSNGFVTWSAEKALVEILSDPNQNTTGSAWFYIQPHLFFYGNPNFESTRLQRGIRRTPAGFVFEHWDVFNLSGRVVGPAQAGFLNGECSTIIADIDFVNLPV